MKLGYVRISNEYNQDPAGQMKLMAEQGLPAEDVYLDMGSGGIEPMKRPQYKKMRERIAKGGIEVLVVSEYSRIGRNVWESLDAVSDILKTGVVIQSLSTKESYINGLPRDLQAVVIVMSMYAAQLERDHNRERTKWGMNNAKQKGTKSGKPIGRPKVFIDFEAVKKFMVDKDLKEAQAIRVLGYSPRTYYDRKKTMSVKILPK